MNLLDVRNASFKYSDGRSIFRDISFSLTQGQILSIIGPNGAGKSTLLGCLTGLLKLASGEIILGGRNQKTMKPREIAQAVSYVPQNQSPAYGYTVRDFVVMGRAPYIGTFATPGARDYGIADEAIGLMGISHLAGRPYTEISGGERQQAAIARAITQRPKIIVMDEPSSSLDCGNQMLVIGMIKKLASDGYGVIMTTHNPDHAIMLDGVSAIMGRSGRFAFGGACEIITEEALRETYGINLKLIYVREAGRFVCVPME